MHKKTILALPLLIAATQPAFAHVGAGAVSGFSAGLAHPVSGPDHLLVMVSVGLWAAMAGGRSVWLWPAAFLGSMLAGALMAMAGVALPLVEPTILASVVAMGTIIGLSLRLPTAAGAGLVALFGLFHGHAHGSELPLAADAANYLIGFTLSTAALHLAGMGLGLGLRRLPLGDVAPRAIGWAVSVAGLALALG